MSNTIAVGVFTVEVTAQVRAKLCTLQVTMGMSMMLYVSAASDVHLCLHLDDDPAHSLGRHGYVQRRHGYVQR